MSTSKIRMSIAAFLVALIAVLSTAPVGSSAPARQTAVPTFVEVTPVATVVFPTNTPVFTEATVESTISLDPTNTPVFTEATAESTVTLEK